ncbi:NAD(P)/FAD-dependent oxidoreductase [uncultured Devosia sp.]|uniref:NAD(P)/FAD-dependent oxidoreductase n=1 Tax=uncultured Devosia sp. TaxID=211434 RepID=UPI0035CB8AB7
MARIAVVGAGIIGSTIAARLLGEGHAVSLYEPEPDGLPTSSGNAALIALPEIAPIASPGMLRAVPGWLLDPLGPLTVRWTDVPALLPWLMAFLASATQARGARARGALTQLMLTALQDHVSLGQSIGLTDHLRQTGYLSVHDSEASVTGALEEAKGVKAALGYDYERLSSAQARRLVPQLEGEFVGAVHQPLYWAVSNPLTVLRRYQSFVAGRGTLVRERVVRVSADADGIWLHTQTGQTSFDKVVVAAGVWSRDLVRGLGVKVLLETERGYNTTYHDLDWSLAMPVGFADHAFVATPLVDGLRVGGAVELARPQTSPNFARAKAMRTKMRRYIPALPEGGTEWMGRRPSTPDSLPVISFHPGDERIVHAFGHGHLGLTLSAVTARLVSQMIAGTAAAAALAPFHINRF